MLSLPDIKAFIKRKRYKESPGIVPPRVYLDLKLSFVRQWETICLEWFQQVHLVASQFLEWVVHLHFNKFGPSLLRHKVEYQSVFSFKINVHSSIIGKFLQESIESAEEQIILYCTMESRLSYGLYDQEYSELQRKEYKQFGDSSSSLDNISDEAALDVISHIRTYFDISSKRITEVIPMICEIFLTEKLEKRLLTQFPAAIGWTNEEECAKYLEDDLEVGLKREDLQRKKKIVKNALEIIGRSMI